MKIKLWSDLHLEFPNSSVPVERDGADVLLLAGDICTAHDIERFVPWFEEVSKTFPDVLYIPGNHEYYHGDWNTATFNIRTHLMHLPNIQVMDGKITVVQGQGFWAGTLWTDFNGGNPITMLEARQGMNDYRLITNNNDLLAPVDTLQEHRQRREQLERILSANPTLPLVVMTHMAPSRRSTHPRYKDDFHANGAYSSDLTSLMQAHPNIKLWVHGHTHDSFDYMEGSTRIVANPAGYPLRHSGGVTTRENKKFNPALILEI